MNKNNNLANFNLLKYLAGKRFFLICISDVSNWYCISYSFCYFCTGFTILLLIMVAYFFNHLNLGPNKSIAIDFRVPLVTGVIRCKIKEGKITRLPGTLSSGTLTVVFT